MLLFPETLLGVKITHIVAGVAGGMVRSLLVGGSWSAAAASIGVGSMTAAYFTTPVYFGIIRYFPNLNDPSTEHAASFIVGMTAFIICEGIMEYVKKRRDKYMADGPVVPPKDGG